MSEQDLVKKLLDVFQMFFIGAGGVNLAIGVEVVKGIGFGRIGDRSYGSNRGRANRAGWQALV